MKKLIAALVTGALICGSFFSCKKAPQYATGLVFSQEDYESIPQKARQIKRAYEYLPASVSLQDYMPYPGNQGDFGTCVAWSSVYGAMTMAYAYSQKITDRNQITQNVFSPYYMYKNCNPSDPEGQNGMNIGNALYFMKQNGIPFRISSEKHDFTKFSTSIYKDKDLFRIMDYATLFSWQETSQAVKVSSVKKSLSEHKPVLISFNTPPSFFSAKEDWNTELGFFESLFYAITGYDPNKPEGGHAMVVIGYDDNRRDGSFLIQNSWGTDWGGKGGKYAGCTWVNYSDFSEYVRGAYELSPLVERKSGICYKGSIKMPVYAEDDELSVMYSPAYKTYATTKNYDSFTRFQLYMTNTMPCYVYAFASDEKTGKTSRIFPPEGTSALLDYSENTVVYPSEEHCIQLDAVEGTDYLVLLYSLEEIDLNSVMSAYEYAVKIGIKSEARLYDRVEHAIGREKIINPTLARYSSGKVDFEGYSTDLKKNYIMPVLIEISHVD